MEFGALFLGDPPWRRVVDLANRAEDAGFDYVFSADSHILWMDAWLQYALIAQNTSRIKLGPLVTNPRTRHPTVVASMLATLNEVSGGRMVCGTGRGDSALRTLGLPPVSLAEWEESIPLIRNLAAGGPVEIHGSQQRLTWASGHRVPMWGAAYGPKALAVVGRQCDGFVLQLADPDILRWTRGHVDDAARAAGRGPTEVRTIVAAPPYVASADQLPHAHSQLRWFAGSVANHVADMIRVHGAEGLPEQLTSFVPGRPEYDYAMHGRAHNPRTEYVPDEINERFCIVGSVDDHVAKLTALKEQGVDVFVAYFIHDAIEQTLDIYGREVIPRLRGGGARPVAASPGD